MDETTISRLTSSDNQLRIFHSVDQFLARPNCRTCVVFDFDECLVRAHLSRQITERFQQQDTIDPINFQDHSFVGIARALQCYVGVSKTEIECVTRQLAAKAKWRPYALRLLTLLMSSSTHTALILSSGFGPAVAAKLSISKLAVQVLACQIHFNDQGVCTGPYMVITDAAKGQVVEQIAATGRFAQVYVVGHGQGDVAMLRAGIGIALKGVPEAKQAAQYVVSSFREVIALVGLH